jgi:transposase
MAAPLPLRPDYDGPGLRALARQSRDADQTRRLLALASIYDGGSRSAAAKLGGVGLQIVRDWVERFNALGQDGLIDRKAPGQRSKLDATQRQALAATVERGSIPAVDGVVRWRLKDLVQWVFEEFAISLDESTMSRELKAMGFCKLSARPRHYAQNVEALEAFKKTSPPSWQRSVPPCRPEPR